MRNFSSKFPAVAEKNVKHFQRLSCLNKSHKTVDQYIYQALQEPAASAFSYHHVYLEAPHIPIIIDLRHYCQEDSALMKVV